MSVFKICASLFGASSECPGTGWRRLTDGFFSKIRPSVHISFLAFHTKVAMGTTKCMCSYLSRDILPNQVPMVTETASVRQVGFKDFKSR